MRDPSLPLSSIRTLTVGFGFAPNLLTLSALSSDRRSRAPASAVKLQTITAGGDFHPALRTFTVTIDGDSTMTKRIRSGKARAIPRRDGGVPWLHGLRAGPPRTRGTGTEA